MQEEEVAIELEEINTAKEESNLPVPEDVDVDLDYSGDTESKVPRILEVHNVAIQSWIATLSFGCFLIVLGMYFLFVQFGSWTVDSIVSICLIGNGLILFFISRRESYIFDQPSGKLQLRRTTWRGVNVTDYWLLHIKDVSVEEYKDPQGGTDFELYLYLRSGQRLKLFSGHIIGVGSSKKLKARDDINNFLNEFNRKYITKSRASHSDFRGIMKRQLSTPIR